MVDRFVQAAGGIDILVNNAGTMIARKTIAEAPVEFFDDEFDTNTKSAFLVTQAALYLKKARVHYQYDVHYRAYRRGGGRGFMRRLKAAGDITVAMAKEFAPFVIRVNAVSPGW
jgi:3-oxoacyl-[acyl-carrier protein] reductase